jgi:hypothetical protein
MLDHAPDVNAGAREVVDESKVMFNQSLAKDDDEGVNN